MSDETRIKAGKLESEVSHLKLEGSGSEDESGSKPRVKLEDQDQIPPTPPPRSAKSPLKQSSRSASRSPIKQQSLPQTPMEDGNTLETVGGDITLKLEPGKAPKLSRSKSEKIVARAPTLYTEEPDATADACSDFEVIEDCIYSNKYIGTTEHALDCDCDDEWDASTKSNTACGEDSDCINRATKMECVGDCRCGTGCLNQRFQNREYAHVTVFKTEKKGYGLRANADLRPNDFIFEYIGEVINETNFRRRMLNYDEEGIKHFYFMSLSKGEFVDATKKGNLGRFCNHSCNPNCYVDKWVVGDKLRMGIFAERYVKAGEELVFNYNVDRYGANPQPCYCGEPNCTGFIGGKTQTERATKLSHAVVEALGIDDGDGWDTTIAKKPRKKRRDEDDEEYVSNVEARTLDEGGVTKVMAALMQCKEKWIAVKLLDRIQRAEDEKVRNRVVKMHGYQILKSSLNTWIEDVNVVIQILEILYSLPRITRNKIQDSKIEETVQKLKTNEDERVRDKAEELLNIWSLLEVGYRIPRVKRDPERDAKIAASRAARRGRDRSRSRERSRSRSLEAPKGPSAPSGPRSNAPQRNPNYNARPPFRPRPPVNPLPEGWFSALANGKTYYYSAAGDTTWERPTQPAVRPPPPPKQITNEQKLQDIINSITSSNTPKGKSENATPAKETPKSEKKEPKWKSYPIERQKQIYETSISPIIVNAMNKYKPKLPREDLKKHAKWLSKKLVASDYKNNRVRDPTKVDEKTQRGLKKFAEEFFAKEYKKHKIAQQQKAQAAKTNGEASTTPSGSPEAIKKDGDPEEDIKLEMDEDLAGLDDEEDATPSDLKRKRESVAMTPSDIIPKDEDSPTSPKKLKSAEAPPPPPPPPPPPAQDGAELDGAEPMEDVTMGSTFIEHPFTDEAIKAVHGTQPDEAIPVASLKFETGDINGQPSPKQLATPSTNGSYPYDANRKVGDVKVDGIKQEAVTEKS